MVCGKLSTTRYETLTVYYYPTLVGAWGPRIPKKVGTNPRFSSFHLPKCRRYLGRDWLSSRWQPCSPNLENTHGRFPHGRHDLDPELCVANVSHRPVTRLVPSSIVWLSADYSVEGLEVVWKMGRIWAL